MPEAGTLAAALAASRRQRAIALISDADVEAVGADALAGAGFAAAHAGGSGPASALPAAEFRRLVAQAAAPSAAEALALQSEASHADAIFAPLPRRHPAQSSDTAPPPCPVDPRFVDDDSSDDDAGRGEVVEPRGSASARPPPNAAAAPVDMFDPYNDPRLVYRNTSAVAAAAQQRAESAPEARNGAAASQPLYALLRAGHRVEALFAADGRWYAGRIVSVTHGGYPSAKYDVSFDGYGGEVEAGVPVDRIRAVAGTDYCDLKQQEGAPRDAGSSSSEDAAGRRYAPGSFLQRLHASVLSTGLPTAAQAPARSGGPAVAAQPRAPGAPQPPQQAIAPSIDEAVDEAAAMLADDASVWDDGRGALTSRDDGRGALTSRADWRAAAAAAAAGASDAKLPSASVAVPVQTASSRLGVSLLLRQQVGSSPLPQATSSAGQQTVPPALEAALSALARALPDERFDSAGGQSERRQLCALHAAALVAPGGGGCPRGDLCRLKHPPLAALAGALGRARAAVGPLRDSRRRASALAAQAAALRAVETAAPGDLIAPGLRAAAAAAPAVFATTEHNGAAPSAAVPFVLQECLRRPAAPSAPPPPPAPEQQPGDSSSALAPPPAAAAAAAGGGGWKSRVAARLMLSAGN